MKNNKEFDTEEIMRAMVKTLCKNWVELSRDKVDDDSAYKKIKFVIQVQLAAALSPAFEYMVAEGLHDIVYEAQRLLKMGIECGMCTTKD